MRAQGKCPPKSALMCWQPLSLTTQIAQGEAMEPRRREIFAEKAVATAPASLCQGLQASQHHPQPYYLQGL